MTAPEHGGEAWRTRHASMSSPQAHHSEGLSRTVSNPYQSYPGASEQYIHPAHQPFAVEWARGCGPVRSDSNHNGSTSDGYLSPQSPPLRGAVSYSNLHQRSEYDDYSRQSSSHQYPSTMPSPSRGYEALYHPAVTAASRPAQLPHSYSSPPFPNPPRPELQHSPYSANAYTHPPLPPSPYATYEARHEPPPAPPPRPQLPTPPASAALMSSDPWVNPAPAYIHPSTPPAPPRPRLPSTSSHPGAAASSNTNHAPPLPPKPPFFYEQHQNPSSSSSAGWTNATPGLTRDSATLSDLLERHSIADSASIAETLPPFSESLPPGYRYSLVSSSSQHCNQSHGVHLPQPHKPTPSSPEERKRRPSSARAIPDRRLLELQEQEARDRELALRLAQEEAAGAGGDGLGRRGTLEWEAFDEVAHSGASGSSSRNHGGWTPEVDDVEDEKDTLRRQEQEEADRAFALELQRQMQAEPVAVADVRGDTCSPEDIVDAADAKERRTHEEERRRQEEADAELARSLMDEQAAALAAAEAQREMTRRQREEEDAMLARKLAEDVPDNQRADEELARALDAQARQAEERIEQDRRAYSHNGDRQTEEAHMSRRATPLSPETPRLLQSPIGDGHLSPNRGQSSYATHSPNRSPAREIIELHDDGWQLSSGRSSESSSMHLRSSNRNGSSVSPAEVTGLGDPFERGAGTALGSRHTEVWIRPGVLQEIQHEVDTVELNPAPGPSCHPLPAALSPPADASSARSRPVSPVRLRPAIPSPQPLSLLPTPTSPSSALHPAADFQPYRDPNAPAESAPPYSPPAAEPSRARSGGSPTRRPTLLPQNMTFDLRSFSGVPAGTSSVTAASGGSNAMSLYPQVLYRSEVPLKTRVSPPAEFATPPSQASPQAESTDVHRPGTMSSSSSHLSHAVSPVNPHPDEPWIPAPPQTPPPPSTCASVTRASSSASAKSIASASSQLSFHTAQRASTAASLATATETAELRNTSFTSPCEDSPSTPISSSPLAPELTRTISTGPLSPALSALPDIALGFRPPFNDSLFHHRSADAVVFPDLVLLEADAPLYISAPTYRRLLQALAHFGSSRVEAPPALIAEVKTVVQTNAVVQFSRASAQSQKWRCILHLEVHPSQQGGNAQTAARGRSPPSSIKARSDALNTVIALPQPSPSLPFTMSTLADYLGKALSDSRVASSDQAKALHRAIRESDPEEAKKSVEAPSLREGILGVFGLGRTSRRADLNEDTYDLVTPFILSDT